MTHITTRDSRTGHALCVQCKITLTERDSVWWCVRADCPNTTVRYPDAALRAKFRMDAEQPRSEK